MVYILYTNTTGAAARKPIGIPSWHRPTSGFLPRFELFDEFEDGQFAGRLRHKAASLGYAFAGAPWFSEESLAPGLSSSVGYVQLLLRQWTAGDDARRDAGLCRAVGKVARMILPLLLQGAITVASSPETEREAVLLALLTMESNLEKLELFPQDERFLPGGHLLVNRVDVSLSVDALESVLLRCVAA